MDYQIKDDRPGMTLLCGCRVPVRNLPLQGGDRSYVCDHGRKWIIRGQVEKTVTMRVEEVDT